VNLRGTALVIMSVKDAAPSPISAGITPEFGSNFLNGFHVEVGKRWPHPFPGSLTKIPSMANTEGRSALGHSPRTAA